MTKTNKSFNAYSLVNALIDNNVLTFDFNTTDIHNVIDNSKYEMCFALTNSARIDNIDIDTDIDIIENDNVNVKKNYVLLRDNNADSVLQFWGQAKKGVVVIEVRQRLFDKIALNDLKLFKEWEKEVKGGQAIERCYVIRNDKDGVKFVKSFFERFEKKTTKATEVVNENEKAS